MVRWAPTVFDRMKMREVANSLFFFVVAIFIGNVRLVFYCFACEESEF